jgi:glycine cleavage system H protein
MDTRKDLMYSKTHEWAKIEGDTAVVGITDFAQHSLGDIVFVEFPPIGRHIESGSDFGVVESVKAVSDLTSPVSGEVAEINKRLEKTPELLNGDPYGNWIVKIKLADVSSLKDLMDEKEYISFCEQEQ